MVIFADLLKVDLLLSEGVQPVQVCLEEVPLFLLVIVDQASFRAVLVVVRDVVVDRRE